MLLMGMAVVKKYTASFVKEGWGKAVLVNNSAINAILPALNQF